MSSGTIVRWLKAVGESVARDEPLLVVETDKAAAEVLAPAAGVVEALVAAEGEVVAVGAVIARLTPSGRGAPSPRAPTTDTAAGDPAPVGGDERARLGWMYRTMLR